MKKGCILVLQLFVLISINVKTAYAKVQINKDKILSTIDYSEIFQINDISTNILGTNNNLSNATIDIDGYDLHFNPNIKNYTLIIGDESKLNIRINYDQSKVIVGGNENLKNGSIITITFIENNNKNTYIIKIQKKAFNQIYFIIIIFILLIINITRILINSTKREKII